MTERLKIQQWFDAGKTEEELLAEYAIKCRHHRKYDNLRLYKYDQIASQMGEAIVQESRGIILDHDDDFRVVCWAFRKFFNHGEGHAAEIDWGSAEVLEKVDGSLMQLYPYKGEWLVASSGTPDAGGEVNGFGITFAQLFGRAMGDRVAYLPDPNTTPFCFAFELTAPENRIVVRHAKDGLTLLGARNLNTLHEIHRDHASAMFHHVIPTVKAFDLSGYDSLESSFADMSPVEQEGYVVVDAHFNRVKVKHPGYVALHHSLGGMSQRALIEIARQGEVSEVLVAFPEFKPQVEEAQRRLDDLHLELDHTYQQIKDIESQKEFAMVATKTRLPSALFTLRLGRTESLRHFFREMRIDSLAEVLGYNTSDKLDRPLLGEPSLEPSHERLGM